MTKPPAAGKGRPKGSLNKTTSMLKEAILKAAQQAGDKCGGDGLVSYLEKQAIEHPAQFMTLLGKVLPLQVADGGDGNQTVVVIRRFVEADGNETGHGRPGIVRG